MSAIIREIRAFFESCVASCPPDRIVFATVPSRPAPLDGILAVFAKPYGALLRAPHEKGFGAGGHAVKIELRGASRFEQLKTEAAALWPRIDVKSWGGATHIRPRLIGGFAFAPDVNDVVPWREFGDGCFTLPRWSFYRGDDRAYLALAVRGDERDDPNLGAEIDRVLEQIEGIEATETFSPSADNAIAMQALALLRQPDRIPPERLTVMPRDEWVAHIEKIRATIGEGTFQKIVAARRSHVSAVSDLHDLDIYVRLSLSYPDCFRFVFRRDQFTFLGATPEALFTKRGDLLNTQALAGTLPVGTSDISSLLQTKSSLQSSSKDSVEHQIVVDSIRATLAPFSKSMTIPPGPEVKRVRHILHLNTPIAATLLPGVHAVDVLPRLHPTPAIGGLPKEGAERWIVENERESRGWYAGCVGWVDSDDDAEFAVAIRSGVVSAREAYIYSGAGIVHESNPDAEYAETALKQRPMLEAIGVVSTPGGASAASPKTF